MRRTATSLVLNASWAICLLTAACAADDDGGTGGGDDDTGRVGRDTGVPGPDLRPGPDAGQDTAPEPDLSVDDLGNDEPDGGPFFDLGDEPDVISPACGALDQACCEGSCDGQLACIGNLCVTSTSVCVDEPLCPTPPSGTPDVSLSEVAGAPPTLAGGTIVDGQYELDTIELYTDGTISGIVDSFSIVNNGGTAGSLVFDDVDWGFAADLDLFISASAIGQNFNQTVAQALDAGGCFVVSGNQLQGDLTECGANWPEGTEPPSSLGYEADGGQIQLLLILTREMILAAVPEEDQFLVGLAVAGDLPILMTFSEML